MRVDATTSVNGGVPRSKDIFKETRLEDLGPSLALDGREKQLRTMSFKV
jgi:hypothetical protein